MPATENRQKIIAFRVSPSERRELALLARAEGKTRSELLRELVREKAEETAGVAAGREDS